MFYGEVLNMPLGEITSKRGGILPVLSINGNKYFCFGVDRRSGDLTDFGGSKEKSDKNIISCSLREFKEESGEIFTEPGVGTLLSSYAVADESTFIMFMNVHVNADYIRMLFHKKYNFRGNREIRDIVWVSLEELYMQLLLGEESIIFYRVRRLLAKICGISPPEK